MLYWFKLLYQTQRQRIGVGVFLAFFTAVSGVSLLMLSGWFITATALAGISISAGLLIVFDMYMPGSGIRFFALSRTVGRYLERLYNHDTILRLVAVFRLSLFKRLSDLSVHELRNTTDSEWLSKLTADLDSLDSILLRFTVTPIITVLLIVCATVFTRFVWPALALYIGLFLLACGILAIALTIKSTKSLGSKSASLLNELRANVIEHLQGRFELKSHHLLQRHERHVVHRLQALDNVQRLMNSRVANIQLLLDILLMLGLCVLAFISLHAVQIGEIDGPVAVMSVLMFVAISEVLQILPTQYREWGRTHYSAERLKPKINESSGAKAALLQPLQSLTVTISNHPKIIVSQGTPLVLSIEKTKMVVVTGRSGSGKTTLANIITGVKSTLDDSAENVSFSLNGEIKPNDLNCSQFNPNIGYVMQANSILAGTLAYNLAIGLDDITEEQLWNALKMVELDKWAQGLKHGINTWLGETGDQISGGQARRITLARLLLRNPALLVLDEPFNGLDKLMAHRIWLNISEWLSLRKRYY